MTDVLTDLSESALRTAIKANYYAFCAALEQSPAVDFSRQPGLVRWRTAILHPLFQGVLVTAAQPGEEEQIIRESRDYFDAHGIPGFCWWLSPTVDPAPWEAALQRLGFVPDDDPPGMALVLDALEEPQIVPGLQIARVRDLATLQVWGETFGVGYELPPQMIEPFLVLIGSMDLDGQMQHYLAYLNGAPVACTSLWLAAGVAGIYNVATIPSARRQGIGAAVTAAALRDAQAMGYTAAILQSSAMGFPVYQRLGFRHLCAMDHHYWAGQSTEGG